jgi:hypothetical protein
MIFGKKPHLQDTSLVAGLTKGYRPAKFQNSEKVSSQELIFTK